jgi:DNA-binding response OmpR family regulator
MKLASVFIDWASSSQVKLERNGIQVDKVAAPPAVLLIEDHPEDRLAIRLHLEVMGFAVYDTPSPVEAMEIFTQHDVSLVIIHLTYLPLRSLEFCGWCRAASTVPILMITCRDEVVDENMCMRAGADDYVSKPVDTRILTSRISQQMQRGHGQRAPRANILTWGDLKMDLTQHQFAVAGNNISLTNTEYQFLQLLMEDPLRIFSRSQILEAVGIMKGLGSDHVVDTHASRLRSKIRKSGGPEVISVIRSVGFRLADSVEDPGQSLIA